MPEDIIGPLTPDFQTDENTCSSELVDNPYHDYEESGIAILESDFNTYSAQLSSKETTFKNLVNGGNTDTLLTIIDNLIIPYRDTLRALLLSYSPYLTREVVEATINHPIARYPHAWSHELILANIEVAYEHGFMDMLSVKNQPLPQSAIDDIQEELDSSASTDMLVKRSEIALLNKQAADAVNQLLLHIKNDTNGIEVDSIRYWIQQRDDVLAETRVVDTYLQEANYASAQTAVTTLNSEIQNYPSHLHDEISDYVSFKNKMIELLSNDSPLDSLNETDHTFMTDMANTGEGLARYQAQELLCFFYQECTEYPAIATAFPQGLAPMSDFDRKKEELLFKVYPNPANTWVTVVLPDSEEQLLITITDLTGKVVMSQLPNQSIFIFDIDQISNGSYLVTVTNVSGTESFGTQKVIIQH